MNICIYIHIYIYIYIIWRIPCRQTKKAESTKLLEYLSELVL